MKVSAVHLLWVLLLAAFVFSITGCSSPEPDNDSVRPWDAPAGGGMMPIQDQQHPN
jgi:hypothetical protein